MLERLKVAMSQASQTSMRPQEPLETVIESDRVLEVWQVTQTVQDIDLDCAKSGRQVFSAVRRHELVE